MVQRIELNDFTGAEAAPLSRGLGRDEATAELLLQRIQFWTEGHPYLTQRLCQAVAADPRIHDAAGVDHLTESLFLSPRARERDDNLLFVRERLLRSDVDLVGLLDLYAKIHRGKRVTDTETNPLITVLRLAGVVRVVRGQLHVRNRIYHAVFNQEWILANTPDAEIRRQRAAFRQGLFRGAAAVGAVVLAAAAIGGAIWRTSKERAERRAVRNFGAVYQTLAAYQDRAEVQQQVQMGGMDASFVGHAELVAARPNKLRLVLKMSFAGMDLESRVISDGSNVWLYTPRQKEYMRRDAPATHLEVMQRFQNSPSLGMLGGLLGLYRYILAADPIEYFRNNTTNIQVVGRETLDNDPAYVMTWKTVSDSGIGPLVDSPRDKSTNRVPVMAWVRKKDGAILKVAFDFSPLLKSADLPAAARNTPIPREMKIVYRHLDIRLNPKVQPETFQFTPPPDAVERDSISLRMSYGPIGLPEKPVPFRREELARTIPPRDPRASPKLIDLSAQYNAPLTETWHTTSTNQGPAANDLSALPRGIETLAGVPFDVRGLVQLSSTQIQANQNYPPAVTNIAVNQRCQRVHFLHATGWNDPDGTEIGTYLIRFENGQRWEIPIVYGESVRDWWATPNQSQPPKNSEIAWTGSNPAAQAAGNSLRLFKSTWENPRPDWTITAIDFQSAMRSSAPFLIAITLE